MNSVLALMLLQSETETGGSGAIGMVGGLVWLALIVLMIAAMWKVFEKAGEPGWAAIVPIYNLVVLLKIAGKPVWWILLFLIPFVNIVVAIIAYIALAQRFGRGTGFALGLVFLPFVFFPILAWGDARFQPAAA